MRIKYCLFGLVFTLVMNFPLNIFGAVHKVKPSSIHLNRQYAVALWYKLTGEKIGKEEILGLQHINLRQYDEFERKRKEKEAINIYNL